MQDTVRSLDSYAENFKSTRLQTLVTNFPDLDEQITYFGEAFTTGEVNVDCSYRNFFYYLFKVVPETNFGICTDQKITTIIPQPGIEEDWDDIQATLSNYERQFQEHLQDMRKQHK